MPVPRITSLQFEALLAGDINRRDTTVDTTMGPVKDLVIRPVSRVLEAQNERVRNLYNVMTLQNVTVLDPTDVEAFVETEQVFKSNGTPAFVTLTFSRASKPTVDLPIPANFPVGTEVDTATGASVTFITLEPATLVAASAGSYFNAATNRYELNVQAASVTTGPSAKVGKNRVTRPLISLPGFDAVTNKEEARGGLAPETNEQLAERYYLRIRGTEIGTPTGLARYARQTFGNIQDTYVVYGNDPDLVRADSDAGAVDCWVLGSSWITTTMTVPFPGRLVLIPFDIQPGVSVVSVSSGASFTENTDFIYVSDAGIYARSTRGQDGIRFLATGAAPAIGDPLTITYIYDNLIVALQAYFGTADYKETGRDELFRRGIEVPLSIQGQLKVRSGNPTTVLQTAVQALLDFINGSPTQSGFKLGQDVERFDLDAVLSRIPGIDNMVYTVLDRIPGTAVNDVVAIASNEYARLSVANLAITLM